MNRRKSVLVKILISLFIFNSLSLYFYFSSHHHATPKPGRRALSHHLRHQLTEIRPHHHHHHHVYLKPWPILPSYLPWSQTPQPPSHSCEAYFGNGFTRRLEVLHPGGDGVASGWFRCHHSETLRSSVCEGGRIRMRPERIKMSVGGERVEEVIGRKEEEELPEFDDGAFEVDGGPAVGFRKGKRSLVDQEFLDRYLPEGEILKHTMRELMESIRVIGSENFECDEWVEEPTLLVTRYEYANVFHTVTDWYSAYVASRVTGLPQRPHMVFVDGHSMTQLEETWTALFSSIRHAKNFSGSVCFRHAILSPLGYETALFKGLSEDIDCQGASSWELWQNPDNKKTARLSEFGEMIKAAFGLPLDRPRIQKTLSGLNILFVRREDYLAHPRHGGKVQSRLDNEQEVYDSLKNWVSKYGECKLNLVNGMFAHMPMKEQIRAIQDASVIVGAHGAGLTHMVSALPGTVILEIVSSEYRRPHFELVAQWKGLKYHPIYLPASYADPEEVITELRNIVRSLGCGKLTSLVRTESVV